MLAYEINALWVPTVILVLRFEFTNLLFCDEIFGIFNHYSNIRVWSDQLSIVIYMRPTPDPASYSFTGTTPQWIQLILHFFLTRTLQSLRHLERTPLGSIGDRSRNYVVILTIPSCILLKDRIPLFHFWGLGSCSSIANVVSSWAGNNFLPLWRGGGF
jgi:hypothetical protein